jgi:hypothetical protein
LVVGQEAGHEDGGFAGYGEEFALHLGHGASWGRKAKGRDGRHFKW